MGTAVVPPLYRCFTAVVPQDRADKEAAQRARADERYKEAAQHLDAERGRIAGLQSDLATALAEKDAQVGLLSPSCSLPFFNIRGWGGGGGGGGGALPACTLLAMCLGPGGNGIKALIDQSPKAADN